MLMTCYDCFIGDRTVDTRAANSHQLFIRVTDNRAAMWLRITYCYEVDIENSVFIN